MTEARQIGRGPFKASKLEYRQRMLLTKVWKAPFVNGVTEAWARRAQEYWDRVEVTYGIVLSDHRNTYQADTEEGPVIATYATVLDVLPGKRLAEAEWNQVPKDSNNYPLVLQ